MREPAPPIPPMDTQAASGSLVHALLAASPLCFAVATEAITSSLIGLTTLDDDNPQP